MQNKINELKELRNDFQAAWLDMVSNGVELGCAVDKNKHKDSLIQILADANIVREDLLNIHNLFVDGLSKIEHELDTSDTLEKILKQFDTLIQEIEEESNKTNKTDIPKIQNSYPLKTLTLDCQERTMRELLKSGYMITSSDFKKPYKEHFRYIETGTSIENGNVIDGQFCVYDDEKFVRQMDHMDFEIKYPVVFSTFCGFLGETQKNELLLELNLNSSKFNVKKIMDDVKEKGALSEYLSFTDVDNQQVCIELSENVYIYSQQTLPGYDWNTDNERDVKSYYTETYNFEDFSEKLIGPAISGFYSSLDELKQLVPNNWKQIALECIFEEEAMGY
ncbi:hypothetical protein [Aliarcobacter butzleri]|uniref:hypothetical protein n=1 Tax=Aliarcobacter butzleri TaxID=28197 RepID=UPI0021B1FA80|nr:hypothetical protein [Aliarcobacter butzleri]MCT7648936.1 hypothetical protein [Aliarcobacter butzleri]